MTHYRSLETLRKDHINLFIALNAAALTAAGFAFKNVSDAMGKGAPVLPGGLNDLMSFAPLVALAISAMGFALYCYDRSGVDARRAYYEMAMAVIHEWRLSEIWDVWKDEFESSRSPPARFWIRLRIYQVETFVLLIYPLVMIAYIAANAMLLISQSGGAWSAAGWIFTLMIVPLAGYCIVDWFWSVRRLPEEKRSRQINESRRARGLSEI
jgi:hypothetical protein